MMMMMIIIIINAESRRCHKRLIHDLREKNKQISKQTTKQANRSLTEQN